MSVSERVAPHLPYLRRFARAVTGSQSSGDAYVVSTLEALLADLRTVYADSLCAEGGAFTAHSQDSQLCRGKQPHVSGSGASGCGCCKTQP